MKTTNWLLLPSLLLIAASCGGGKGSNPQAADAALAVADATPVFDAGPDAAPPVECDGFAELPVTATALTGFSGAEDFAFDAEGNLVSNNNGNITKQPKTGNATLLAPNIGETAGIRFLSNGDLVVAEVGRGELLRIDPGGISTLILSGLAYPNGVEIDKEDFVYVTEQNAGQIRRIHPTTGEFTIIAEGLYNPNGVSFSPDYSTLYVNSFGGGTLHKVVVDDAGVWSAPELLGVVGPDHCEGLTAGDACPGGTCEDDGASGLQCTSTPPCQGKSVGDWCARSDQGGLCADDGSAGLECSAQGNGPLLFSDACVGVSGGDQCTVMVGDENISGTCEFDWSGVYTCNPGPDFSGDDVCAGKANGETCQAAEPSYGAYSGFCSDSFGFSYCIPEGQTGSTGDGAGLDGMAVDACGNVYVTEYVAGKIWRFSPEGVRAEVATLPSAWIPNMHWGSGLGGWDEKVLYVMDRFEGQVFELELGVVEKERVYP